MDILDDMGVSKLSAKVLSEVNNSFNYNPHGTWDVTLCKVISSTVILPIKTNKSTTHAIHQNIRYHLNDSSYVQLAKLNLNPVSRA